MQAELDSGDVPGTAQAVSGGVDADRAAGRATPASPKDVEKLLADDTTYQFFAWYERHLQRMKYSGRHGLAPHYAHTAKRSSGNSMSPRGSTSETRSELQAAGHYVSIDTHQHPGGVWSDEVAGYVYERGAKSTAPLLNKAASLHHRLRSEVLARAGGPVKNVVDLGCGFGGSTQPFYVDHPEIEVVGVELSEPVCAFARRAQRSRRAMLSFDKPTPRALVLRADASMS